MQREESISAQLRAMKKYCDEKGWSIVKCYVYAVGYIKCKDANGDDVILYTDFMAVTFSSIAD